MPCIRPTVRDIRAVCASPERNYERFISNRTSSDYRNSTGSLLSRLGGGFGWKSKAFGLGAKPARRLGRGAFPWIGGRRGGDDRGLPRRTVTCPRRGGRDHRGRRKCAAAIRNSPDGIESAYLIRCCASASADCTKPRTAGRRSGTGRGTRPRGRYFPNIALLPPCTA